MKQKPMLTVSDVCYRLGLSGPQHVYRLIADGSLTAVNVGKGKRATWRIDPGSLENFIDARRSKRQREQMEGEIFVLVEQAMMAEEDLLRHAGLAPQFKNGQRGYFLGDLMTATNKMLERLVRLRMRKHAPLGSPPPLNVFGKNKS